MAKKKKVDVKMVKLNDNGEEEEVTLDDIEEALDSMRDSLPPEVASFMEKELKRAKAVDDNTVVIKEIPIRDSWKADYDLMRIGKEQLEELFNQVKINMEAVAKAKSRFWKRVEVELDDFDHQMSVNFKKGVVKIHEKRS